MSKHSFLAVLSLHLLFAGSRLSGQTSAVDLVNPMIGTAADGQTYPAAGMPFGMTQWAPQTRSGEVKCVAPYYVADTRIQGFRGSHFLSGSCTQDYGSVTLMPLLTDARLDPRARSSSFNHTSEIAHPYLYEVELSQTKIHAGISGTERAGILRFRFPQTSSAFIAIENNARNGAGNTHIDLAQQEITGENPVYRIYTGNGKSAGFSGFFVIRFDRPFLVGGTFSAKQRHPGSIDQIADSTSSGAYVSFKLDAKLTVQARIGMSFTSLEEARKNLDAEIPGWDFDAVVENARTAWTRELDHIQIAGNSPDRVIFYTAMYHSMLLPRIFSDHDGSYRSFGGSQQLMHADGFTYYCDYSIWDTFRALHPLLAILDPSRELDMVKSLIVKGQQGAFLPIYPAWNSYTSEMIGDHADSIIADAYVKGIRSFDTAEAYRLMKQNATVSPSPNLYIDGRGRRALTSYLKYGYIPLEDKVKDAFHTQEQVSRTLEYAYDDFLVGEMGSWLGHPKEAHDFDVRAQNYRNVIDPATGFARGRHADGTWDGPFDPGTKYSYITEGLPFQYTFFVPQDIPGLIELEHGPKPFVAKLDELFAKGYYDHGNEPSHHIAYLYGYAGDPEKTQQHVHEIMSTQYRNAPGGLAGNDDAGQMSAWYVMSALGFYPVTPGTPNYALGTPRFDDITLSLAGGKILHIRATGAEAGKFYVRSVRVNGQLLNRNYLLHQEIVGGGDIFFEMANSPRP
jgi:predicted alpha-1,2-mannosidase